MSRTRRNIQIKVTGQQRQEPDVRRLAKAIIRLSLEGLEGVDAEERLADLDAASEARARRRRAGPKPASSTERAS